MSNPYVKLLEVLEVYRWFQRCCNIFGSLILLLCGLELVKLLLYDIVLNLLEEQFRLSQLVACLEQLRAAEACPLASLHVDE